MRWGLPTLHARGEGSLCLVVPHEGEMLGKKQCFIPALAACHHLVSLVVGGGEESLQYPSDAWVLGDRLGWLYGYAIPEISKQQTSTPQIFTYTISLSVKSVASVSENTGLVTFDRSPWTTDPQLWPSPSFFRAWNSQGKNCQQQSC